MGDEILGVGVDMESITRFKNKNSRKARLLLDKIFTKKELEYCLEKPNPPQHLAVRFAGKEATIKAVSGIHSAGITPKSIEILNEQNGAPKVIITGKIGETVRVLLSLSHSGDNALAFAIATKKQA